MIYSLVGLANEELCPHFTGQKARRGESASTIQGWFCIVLHCVTDLALGVNLEEKRDRSKGVNLSRLRTNGAQRVRTSRPSRGDTSTCCSCWYEKPMCPFLGERVCPHRGVSRLSRAGRVALVESAPGKIQFAGTVE